MQLQRFIKPRLSIHIFCVLSKEDLTFNFKRLLSMPKKS